MCPYDKGDLTPVTDRSLFDEHTGRIFSDKYRIGKVLGAGGMGCVHEAVNLRLDQPVAVKFFSPRFIASTRRTGSEAAERFRREATIMAKARHPNVVRVLDFAVESDGTMYLVMELLDGEPLDAVLAHGELSVEQALIVLQQMLKALEYVHGQGVIHRDLKPSNVFCAAMGEHQIVKVLDFGIARIAGAETITDGPLGTWRYAAPEQLAGAAVGPGADIYSAGIILHEMLAGGPKSQNELPDDVPNCLRELVVNSTSHELETRLDSADEMSKAIEEALGCLSQKERLQLLPKPIHADDVLPSGAPTPEVRHRGNLDPTPVAIRTGRLKITTDGLSTAPAEMQAVPTVTLERKRTPLIATLVLCILVMGGGLFWLGFGGPTGEQSLTGRSIGGGSTDVPSEMDAAAGETGDAAESASDASREASTVADGGDPSVRITFVSTPRAAKVFLLDSEGREEELCETSCLHDLRRDPRSVKVLFRHTGHADQEVTFVPDVDRIVEVTLSKRHAVGKNGSGDPRRPTPQDPIKGAARGVGYINVRAIPQSDVFLDGRRIGRSPIIKRAVPAGRHQIRLVPRREVLGQGVSRAAKNVGVTIAAGETKNIVEYW